MNRTLSTLAIVGFFILSLILTIGLYFHWQATAKTPSQPLGFSHAWHAGKLQLPCTHCHVNVDKSRQATVPAMSICMKCHDKAGHDKEGVKQLLAYFHAGKQVPWNKVHDLPAHVYFSHKRHIKAGVSCTICHGEVTTMEVIRPVRSLEMGWCVGCHRNNGAPTDCLICHR